MTASSLILLQDRPHVVLLSGSLQVEQLFCLGLKSRSECLTLLEVCDWNLEVASTQMLDNYGSTTRQRYCVRRDVMLTEQSDILPEIKLGQC